LYQRPGERREPPYVPSIVIPAKAGTHGSAVREMDEWIPAFAGMTERGREETKR